MFFEQLQFDNYTLDVDSSIITCYGEQKEVREAIVPPNVAATAIIRCLLL